MGVVGSELVTNPGPFTNTAGWTESGEGVASVNAGKLVVTNSGALYGNLGFSITTVAGKTYKIVTRLASVSDGQSTQVMIGTTQGNPDIANPAFPAPGVNTTYIVAVGTTTVITLFSGDALIGHSATWESISCVQVTGNHATQTTAINRPTVQQDGGGRYYASFNGTNQSLALSSVPFQMVDDFAVVACLTISALPAGVGVIFALGSATAARLQLYGGSDANIYANFVDDAGITATIFLAAAANVGTPMVLTMRNISGSRRLSKNAGTEQTTATVLGTATFSEARIAASTYGGTGNFANILIYDIDIIKGTVTDAQLLILEKAAAQRAGITI